MNICVLIFCLLSLYAFPLMEGKQENLSDMVVATTQIKIKGYPNIWNPSIVKTKNGFLLTFRYTPVKHELSYVGIIKLDESLKPIGKPQFLNTRNPGDKIDSHSEDARIFSFNGEPYVIYNDSIETNDLTIRHRREMYVAKVLLDDQNIRITRPIKLYHPEKHKHIDTQKNWVPFIWDGVLLLGYSLNPHEVLYPNLSTGESPVACRSSFFSPWRWGNWRGGTPAVLVDGEYLAFFHSSMMTRSEASNGVLMYHYYMGAYTFSAEPPFNVLSASIAPIVGRDFYTASDHEKRVIFPGGFVVVGSSIYVAYGKDDCEVWIAILDKSKLKKSMLPVEEL
ncbi:MAG: hypothetical protein H0T62_01915 [Parachlamydiaceae bacterium]|nr:hypothetical protein [Parachlamydiaceae bacterium]